MSTPYDKLLQTIKQNDEAATDIIKVLEDLEIFKTSSSTEKSEFEGKLTKANESLSNTITKLTDAVKLSRSRTVIPADGKRKTKRRSKKRSKKRS